MGRLIYNLAGTEGFEPPRWLDQNQLPYHLATSHHSYYLIQSTVECQGLFIYILNIAKRNILIMFFNNFLIKKGKTTFKYAKIILFLKP